MIRFAALNYSSSEEDSQDAQERAATKEAEESEAFTLYNRALSLQRQGSNEKAEEAFKELLEHPFITEALELLGDNVEGSTHPALQLLYSIHKNIASMALHRNDQKAAIMSYIEAVKIDTTEVTVWYKIGAIAKQIYNFPLARMGFEVGLQCNPNHWPCLDNVITLLYAMNDFWYCLHYISKALVKDPGYTKGLVFRKQIFKEEPSLIQTTVSMFKDCDPSIDFTEIDQEERDEYVNESLLLAEERRKLSKPKQPDMIKLPTPIQSYTWCALGEALLALYKMLKLSNPPLSMGRRVDLSAYSGQASSSADVAGEQPMETDQKLATADGSVIDEMEEQFDAKTVTSLEQILSNLPAEQMTELLQSTPPTPTTVSASMRDPMTSYPSPMETDHTPPVDGLPKIVVTPENLPKQNDMTENINTPTDTGDNLLSDYNSPTTDVLSTTDTLSRNLFSVENLSRSKGSKRKKGTLLEDLGGKRRSARVRNTSKRKEEDCVNFQGLLLTFLPPALRDYDEEISRGGSLQALEHVPSASCNKPTGRPYSVIKDVVAQLCDVLVEIHMDFPKVLLLPIQGLPLNTDIVADSLCDTEDADIRQLLLAMQKNSGCLDLMMQFLFILAEKTHYKWPVGLSSIYLRLYKMTRKHFDLPDTYSDDEINDNLLELGKTLLLCIELQLDQWTVSKSRFHSSPRQPQSPGMSLLKESDLPSYYYDDEYFMAGMISRSDVFESFWSEYCIRVYWMKARFFMLQGKMEDAVFFFKKTLSCLKDCTENGSGEEVKITLPNCTIHNILSIDKVEEQLKSLERSQSFEETQRLYDAGEYGKVVESLLKTSQNQVSIATSATERRSQLLLLQDSLIKLEDYKRSFLWSEIALDESVRAYKKSSMSEKEQWADTLVQTCVSLTAIQKKDENSLSDLPEVNQARLANNLIFMIDVEMSVPESCTDMPIGTVLPWILLYKLIVKDENKEPKTSLQTESGGIDRTVPASLMLLNIAHEYLGRHAWCTKSDGEFLLFYIGVLTSDNSSELFNEELGQAVEQCFYCLYGHPTKKGRYRHLVDHNAPWIQLTWDRAEDIFEYFKPKTLPEFDSYKTDAVAGEVENLLRKICELVPESQKPMYVIDSLHGYIEGTSDVFDEESIYNPTPVSQEIYYLLADYYFKNNDQAKAIKYYCYDICVNPKRLDSWAGMALARMSQLEQKLNSTELRMDFPVHKKSISALRCFRRALQIDDYNGKLWIEYGSLAYQLYSHSARQLKWKDSFPLSPDMEQIAMDSRQEMLQTAHNCYKKAKESENEEEWIQHYMIGKCLEKMKTQSIEFLTHYEESAECLYEENAPYPKKIAYAYTTPHLAVEALEMFYRLHASIVKILLNKHNGDQDFQLFERFVNKAAISPFASAKQKNEILESKDLETDTSKRPSSTSQDHTYSKQKQDKTSSLLQRPSENISVQSSLLQPQPGVVSLDNSSQSCSDSASQESIYVSSDSINQSKDISSDVSAESSSQPMEMGDTAEQAPSDKQSESRTIELSADDMSEEISDIDPAMMTNTTIHGKSNPLDILKNMERGSDSPLSVGSSDMFEDEDGNITVTAKLEVIGRLSSSEEDTTVNKIKAAVEMSNSDKPDVAMVTRESFGFEPMLTDDTDQPTQDIQTKEAITMYSDESSQDIKDSVDKTLENLVSAVDTVDNIVSEITRKSETAEIDNEMQTDKENETQMQNKQQNDGGETKSDSSSMSSEQKTEMSDDNLPVLDIYRSENDSLQNSDQIHSQKAKNIGESEPQSEGGIKKRADNPFIAMVRSRIASLCPAYDSASSEDEQKSENATVPDGMPILHPAYKSVNSEDEEFAKKQKNKGNPKQDVQVLANVSLCADYDSLSSENEESGSDQINSGKSVPAESKVEKDENKLFDQLSYSANESVHVLEISEGGISGDVMMQQNKSQGNMADIDVKNGEQMTSQNTSNSCTEDKNSVSQDVQFIKTENAPVTIDTNQIKVEDNKSSGDKVIEGQVKLEQEPVAIDINHSAIENIKGTADKVSEGQIKSENEPVAMDTNQPVEVDNMVTDGQVKSEIEPVVIDTNQFAEKDNKVTEGQVKSENEPVVMDTIQSAEGDKKVTEGEIKSETDSKSKPNNENVMDVDEKIDIQTSLSQGTQNTETHVENKTNIDNKTSQENKDGEIKMDTSEMSCDKDNEVINISDSDMEDENKTEEGRKESLSVEKGGSEKDGEFDKEENVREKENDGGKNEGGLEDVTQLNGKEGTEDVSKLSEHAKKDDITTKSGDIGEGKVTMPSGKKGEENVKELSGKTGEQLHKLLIEKCMAALHLCLSRFPTHYKSIYRLADVYVNSPYHKNLKFAQDLLLGVPSWQQQSHMPAQGLFGERKQMNFFQGIWRIPIGDIDRSGSFASHMNKAVLLLLKILKERNELSLMYQVHLWMNRTPESGKKYLRDSERMLFVKLSFQYCWEIIDKRNKELSKMTEKDKAEKILMEVYKIWNYGNSSKMRIEIKIDTNHIFTEAYKAVLKDKVVADRPLVKQAIDFCQHYNSLAKSQMQKSNQENQNVGNKPDSTIFSPSRSQFPSFSPARQTTMQSPGTRQTVPSQQQHNYVSASISSSVSVADKSKSIFQQKLSSGTVSSPISAIDKSKVVPSATASSSAVGKSSYLMSSSKLTETVKIVLPKIDRIELPKKFTQKSSVQIMQQKDPKIIQKKMVPKPVAKEPVVETLVENITSASIFETLLANEFGDKPTSEREKSPDEVDGTAKTQSVQAKPQKQTIVVSNPSSQPIICKVDDTRGGLNIVSPDFGSLEVLTPNTPCPDTMKFSVPSKDPKTKTTIVITKKRPPLKITEPIEISSSDDDNVEEDRQNQAVTSSNSAPVQAIPYPVSMQKQSATASVSMTTSNKKSSSEAANNAKPKQQVKRSVIRLDDIQVSADDSIPSSNDSGSEYVPDESSSDSIPSSPEPSKPRLDEVTGLFIPPDVKFFNDNQLINDDDD